MLIIYFSLFGLAIYYFYVSQPSKAMAIILACLVLSIVGRLIGIVIKEGRK